MNERRLAAKRHNTMQMSHSYAWRNAETKAWNLDRSI